LSASTFSPQIGYGNASAISQAAGDGGTNLRDAAIALGVTADDEFDRIVVGGAMAGNARRELGLS